MILAAGLTPAWQYVLVFSRLSTGRVNRATDSQWFASGKALNAGLGAHHLGVAARTLSPQGGPTGRKLVGDFMATGAAARWIECAAPTRICTTLVDNAARVTTELVENSPALSPDELRAFEAAFVDEARTADVLVLSGSLPPATPHDFYRQMLAAAAPGCPALHGPGPARLVLDARGPELVACLPWRPFLVKPNRDELEAMVGQPLANAADLVAAMRHLNRQGAEWVLVTDGAEPAWLTSAGEAWRVFPAGGLACVNPIGCGDSVAAGVAVGLSNQEPIARCMQLGFGAAAANLEQLRSCRFSAARALALADRVIVEAG